LAATTGEAAALLPCHRLPLKGRQAAARKIDEGLEVTPTEEQPAEVNQENVGKMSAKFD